MNRTGMLKPVPQRRHTDPPKREHILFVFRGVRGGNVLSAATYPATNGSRMLCVWVGSNEYTLRYHINRPSTLSGSARW